MKPSVSRALALGALISPTAAYALGLGDIRLNSALNQPFDAEIELVAATPEDLAALRAALASSETFGRYGLDKPAYLADFSFRVTRGSDGRNVLRVTSPKPVTEPFVTLLVEASWPRGRLLREYTVLLDPPTFATAAPVEAPSVANETAPRAAAPPALPPVAAESESPASAPAVPEPARPESPRAATAQPEPVRESTYLVQPNDTLYRIASRIDTGSRGDVNQAMVALYQGNPTAFDSNINVLRSGALLAIPTASQVSAIPARAAADEVARQYRSWQDGRGAAVATDGGRLRLVPPQQGSADASTTQGDAATAATASLETRVRQLESALADARRLIELQSAELAALQGRAAAVDGPAAEPGVEPAADSVTADTPEAEAVAQDQVPAPVVPDATEAEADAAAAAEPIQETRPAAKARSAEPEAPSLFARLADYWWLLAAALVVLLGGLFALLRRRRTSEDADESLEETFASREARRGARNEVAEESGDIVVEERRPLESSTVSVPGRAVAGAAAAVAAASVVETSAPSADSSDPLAEADFHMAYGLYDQAADMVRAALRREPGRRDLQLKLLEVYFVWGDRERFLEIARQMHGARGQADSAAEWDKVIIMGRQIAPEDAMFGAAIAASSDLDLDLDLDTAIGRMELDVQAAHGEISPDIDLAATTPGVLNESGLDFVLDEPGRGSEIDLSKLAPTVEMPQPALAREVVAASRADSTDELSIDRLGLEIDALTSSLGNLDQSHESELSGTASRDSDGTVELQPYERPTRSLDETAEDLLSTTAMLKMQTGTAEALTVIVEADELDPLDHTDYQVELPTIETPRPSLRSTDETLLAGDLTAYADVSFPPLIEESSTMNEIGTKLDLARAYIDMGDPEGARSILDEVVDEGSDTQQQEAQRLIAALP